MSDPLDGLMDKGEKLLWRGRPEPYRLADCYPLPITAVLLGIGVYLCAKANAAEDTYGYVLASGVAALCFGLLAGIPFLRELVARKHTHYAVTSIRVIVVIDAFPRRVLTRLIADIPVVHKSLRGDGLGTLAFGNPPTRLFSADPANRNTVRRDWADAEYDSHTPVFYDIKDVEQVDELVNQLRIAARASSEVPYR